MTRRLAVSLVVFSAGIGLLWSFPSFWYAGPAPREQGYAWLGEQSNVAGWNFNEIPVGKSAESILVADRIFNGEFTRADGAAIQVFGAKRYLEKENEIGLFSHTPDRCWTAVGWKILPTEPDFLECEVHALKILFERRIFGTGDQRALVYFGAVVGGKPLPYRLDQYLAAGSRRKDGGRGDSEATWLRLMQPRLWSWAWESFVNRTPLAGPQQFIRISTALHGTDPAGADKLLTDFLPQWLRPTDYRAEFDSWRAAGVASVGKSGGEAAKPK